MEMHRDPLRPSSAQVVPETGTTAKPVVSTIKNPLIKTIDKQLQRSMKALETKADPDSTKPFLDWLGDFSKGLRAAGKSGDQTLGAVATGFEVARAGKEKRIATALTRKTTLIDNIKKLSEARDELMTGAATGTAASALFSPYADPDTVFGKNGMVPERYVKEIMGLEGKAVSFREDAKGGLILKEWTRDPKKTVRLYAVDKNGFTKVGNYRDVVTTDPEFKELMSSKDWTDQKPDNFTEIATTADKMVELSGNKISLPLAQQLVNNGRILKVERNAAGKIVGWNLEQGSKKNIATFQDPNTLFYYSLDKNDALQMDFVQRHGLTETTIQQAGLTKNTRQLIEDDISSAHVAVGLIDNLFKMSRDAEGKRVMLGSIADLKGGAQSLLGVLRNAAPNMLGFTSLANELMQDIDAGVLESGALSYFNRDLAKQSVIKNALVYKMAKILKTGRRLNLDDVERAERTLGFKGINSEADILAKLDFAKNMFRKEARKKEEKLRNLQKGVLKIPGVNNVGVRPQVLRTPTAKHIQIMKNNINDPDYRKFFIRNFGKQALKDAIDN